MKSPVGKPSTEGCAPGQDLLHMQAALRLARRALGLTSPNPMVGAVLVKQGRVIGRGYHKHAGKPHAEIEALKDSQRRKADPAGATLYVTLEPCCTQGLTPPCTDAIIAAGIARVVAGATDPNPAHQGKGFIRLRRHGIQVTKGVLAEECTSLNAAFNHWIVHRRPWVTVKAAMTLDGKIATASGESKWITGPPARAHGMALRRSVDAILVGVNTVLSDDPSLTLRTGERLRRVPKQKVLRRIVLDSLARTPLSAKVVSDEHAGFTTIVVGPGAPQSRVRALARKVTVLIAPEYPAAPGCPPRLDLNWLMNTLGSQGVTSLLVEGGGEVNASFLLRGLAHRICFFYAPKILGGKTAKPAVGGAGARNWDEVLRLQNVRSRRVGSDLMLEADVAPLKS